MTRRDHAEFVKWTNYILGAGLCLTVLLAPLGIALIKFGRRRAKEILEAPIEGDDTATAVEIGIASSWDDLPDSD